MWSITKNHRSRILRDTLRKIKSESQHKFILGAIAGNRKQSKCVLSQIINNKN